jgi:hypothetical protein
MRREKVKARKGRAARKQGGGAVGLSASCAAQAHDAVVYSLERRRDGREPQFATLMNPASAEILMMASIHCMAF